MKASQLRVVPGWGDTYTVETRDGLILAGPYVRKDEAVQAKRDIAAGGTAKPEARIGS